jgi:hypothetical protein
MTTIRECTLYPARVTLIERDQFNDYSVVFDHELIVEDNVNRYRRAWHVGTNRAKAIAAYETA